ncbi:MAG: hypothetical protein ACE5EG_11840, partial [Thermoanaerobaculia bacterium]
MKRVLMVVLLLLAVAGAMMLMAKRSEPRWSTDSPEALAALERGLAAQMKFYGADAQAGYKEALELDPDFVAAKVMVLLHSYDRKGELAEELRQADLERLTSRERFLVRYVLARGEGDGEEADRIVRAFLEEHPEDPFALATCSTRA